MEPKVWVEHCSDLCLFPALKHYQAMHGSRSPAKSRLGPAVGHPFSYASDRGEMLDDKVYALCHHRVLSGMRSRRIVTLHELTVPVRRITGRRYFCSLSSR